jgi:PAS domain S-box-containing protein
LFDRFHRVENVRSRTHEGSGIGLALVQELVKLHGGTVSVESVADQGSTFIVSVPLGSAHLPADRVGGARSLSGTAIGAAPFVEEALRWLPTPEQDNEPILLENELLPVPCPPSSEGTGTGRRPVVLIADDNADMRQYLSRLLAERYEVLTVPDGQAALASVSTCRPDLILTDVMMPHLDGFGLLRELRADPKTRTVPVIVLSARAGEESRVEGMEHGADDYLIKPFSARELLARVQTHLEMARVRKNAQEALTRRTAQFETLLNELPMGVYLLDGNLRIRQANPQAMQLFGNVPDVIGREFSEVITEFTPEAYADEIIQRFRHTLDTGEPFSIAEQHGQRLDGKTERIYEWQINRIVLPEEGYGVVCYFRDVSLQVQARHAVAESAQRLRFAAEAAQIGFWFSDLPLDKLLWDHRVKEHFWLSPDEDVTIQTFYERLHPDDREPTRRAIEECIANGTPYTAEYRTVSPDGRIRWVRAIGHTFYDDAGRPTRFDGLNLDVTERKQAEERERQITAEAIAANAKFRALFEQSALFAGIMAKDGIVLEANRSCLEVCGYRSDEVIGKLLWDTPWWRHHPESQQKIRAATPLAALGIPFRDTLDYSFADGTERQVDFGLYPIVDESGRVIFLHPTGLDITDVKRAEENYRQLAETLESEVRLRTLELENRNAEVLQQSELLRTFSQRLLHAQDEERRRIARDLHDSAGQTLAVLGLNLGQFLQKIQQQAPALATEAGMINDTVQQLQREIRTTSYLLHPPLLDETGLASALNWYVQGLVQRTDLNINVEIPNDFGRLNRDLELVVFRLVQECLTNIHRHSGSKIATIVIRRDSDAVTVQVSDAGQGMSARKLAEVQSGGSGVGIRGMHERLRQFKGKLSIQSDSSGTRITATIPTLRSPSATKEDGAAPLRAVV